MVGAVHKIRLLNKDGAIVLKYLNSAFCKDLFVILFVIFWQYFSIKVRICCGGRSCFLTIQPESDGDLLFSLTVESVGAAMQLRGFQYLGDWTTGKNNELMIRNPKIMTRSQYNPNLLCDLGQIESFSGHLSFFFFFFCTTRRLVLISGFHIF